MVKSKQSVHDYKLNSFISFQCVGAIQEEACITIWFFLIPKNSDIFIVSLLYKSRIVIDKFKKT